MTKLSRKFIDPKYFGHYINNLWSAFTLMDSKEDIRILFKDLFTHTEYKMFAKRLEISRRLLAGQTYEEIKQALKVTSRTINNISNILSSAGVGLRKADKKLHDLETQYQKRREKKQDFLERRNRPKLSGERLLSELLKTGITIGTKVLIKKNKHKSAQK